jgi:transposase
VPAIARLVAADEYTVRDVIHAFNERGLAALDPRWAGGRPRLISDADIAFIVTRPRPDLASWAIRLAVGASASSPRFWPATQIVES